MPHSPVVAVLAHGAGSTADFVARAFPADALGVDRVIALDDRTGSPRRIAAAIAAAVAQEVAAGRRVVVGGVSLGAHAAASWAGRALREQGLRSSMAGVVLALPAWTGPPGAVAAATGAAGAEIARVGVAGVLARLAGDPALAGDWVLAELARAWPRYGDDVLVRALATAAGSAAPSPADLARVAVPAVVVALADDPLHPQPIAREWATCLPDATLRVVERHAPAADRAVLGRAAGRGLAALRRDQDAASGPR